MPAKPPQDLLPAPDADDDEAAFMAWLDDPAPAPKPKPQATSRPPAHKHPAMRRLWLSVAMVMVVVWGLLMLMAVLSFF